MLGSPGLPGLVTPFSPATPLPLGLLRVFSMFDTFLVIEAHFALQELKHCGCVFKALDVVAARFFQGSPPHLCAAAIPLTPHPEHVRQVARISTFLWLHRFSLPVSMVLARA